MITPEIYFSKLIRRGVVSYAGKFSPQMLFFELIMRGNSVSHYVDRPVFWGKQLLRKIGYDGMDFNISPPKPWHQ